MTLTDANRIFAEDYVWLRGYSPSTCNNYRWTINSIVKAIGDKDVSEIDYDDMKKWRRYMDSHQYEVGAVNSYLYKFRLMLRFFSKRMELKLDPEDIVIPKKKKTIPKFLSSSQVDKMIEAGDVREKAIVSVLYSSGVRVSELVAIRRKDIYEDIVKIRGKGNQERLAFLDERSKRCIQSYLCQRSDTCPFLFYSNKCRGLSKHRVQDLIRNLGVKAGIPQIVTPHQLRHSIATHLHDAGMDINDLKDFLGHADISTTQIYVHTSKQSLHDKVKRCRLTLEKAKVLH